MISRAFLISLFNFLNYVFFIQVLILSSTVTSGGIARRWLHPTVPQETSSPILYSKSYAFQILLDDTQNSVRYGVLNEVNRSMEVFGDEPVCDPTNACYACLEVLGDDREKIDYCKIGCKIWVHNEYNYELMK
jgi:hypothetical protein